MFLPGQLGNHCTATRVAAPCPGEHRDVAGLARQEIQNMATATSGRRGLLVMLSEAQLALAVLCLWPVRERKAVRAHLSLPPGAGPRRGDQAPSGAGRPPVDIRQTDAESWMVLTDPEGDEFCLVRPRTSLATKS